MIGAQVNSLLVATHGYVVARDNPSRNLHRWAVTAPLRYYLRRSPIKRGKGVVRRLVLRTCMHEPENLNVTLPCGAKLNISTAEIIGQHLAIYGEFERSELEACSRLARPGTTSFDVGSNVGMFALTMSMALGDSGRVFAFEPLQHNFSRLQMHVAKNNLKNVEAIRAAAGAAHGIVQIENVFDPAYVTCRPTTANSEAGTNIVPVLTLDEVWHRSGRPEVSVIKIDVEGAEPEVIAGATEMLASSRPHVLVEAPTANLLDRVSGELARFGLEPSQPSGFERWNYLFGV